jgi:hypothetical protein
MPNLSPIRIAIIGVDKMTAPIRMINSHIRSTLKPVSDLSNHIGRLVKATGISRVGSAFGAVKNSVGEVASAVSGLVTKFAFAGGILGAGLYSIVNGAAEAGDTFSRLAYQMGLPVIELQKLSYAADLADVPIETFNANMLKFGRGIADAASGAGTALPAFRALGVSVKDASGRIRPAQSVLLDVAKVLEKIENPLQRNRVLVALFGKSGIEMASMLKGGRVELERTMAEASKYGLITDENVKKSEEFSDAQKRSRYALIGLRNVIGTELMPIFTQWMGKLQELIIQYKPQIQEFARSFAEGLPERISGLVVSVKNLWNGFQPIISVFKSIVDFIGPVNTAMLAVGGIIAVTVIPAVASLISAIGMLSIAFAVTPFGWVIVALSGIVIATMLVIKYFKQIKEFFGGIGKSISKSASRGFGSSFGNSTQPSETSPDTGSETPANPMSKYIADMNASAKGNMAGFNITAPENAISTTNTNQSASPWTKAPAPSSTASKSEVVVRFENAPKGMTVKETRSDVPVKLDLGYASAGTW